MNLALRNRRALIIGGSSGIGAAIALSLAAEGADLTLAARRLDRLDAVVSRAKESGASDARSMIVDLEDPASVTRFSHELVNGSWHPEILILNGGGPKPGSIATLQLEDWDRAYQSTFRSMLSLAYAVLPGMRTAKWGRIVALTSTTVKQPIANMPLSNSFRIALLSTMKTLAGDVAHEGITVNSIATGRIRTDRLRELYGSDAAMDSAATNEIPIGRVAEPEEFAPLVTFLCGEPARYITGQTIAIDGGLVRGIFG